MIQRGVGVEMERRSAFFDFLRVLSVFLVITSHYSYMFDASLTMTFPREYLTGGIGRLGVSFFFIISGALAGLSLQKYPAQAFWLRRMCSVLIPYNIVYFGMGGLLLALGYFFDYPRNPVGMVLTGVRPPQELLLSVLGIDHYLHGVYGINTLWFTGEWFIGCIILLYAVAPLIFKAGSRYPAWTLAAAVGFSVILYDSGMENPYWSATVRVSDFAAGMLFIRSQKALFRYETSLTLCATGVIVAGVGLGWLKGLAIREVLFPLSPVSLLFALSFFFIVLTAWRSVHTYIPDTVLRGMRHLAGRAYIIMLLQHVVIIFINSNIHLATLRSWQAVGLYFLVLLLTERLSALFKPVVSGCERWVTARLFR